jgi:ABC-type multidrug transport system fused ATPase/permease subunit
MSLGSVDETSDVAPVTGGAPDHAGGAAPEGRRAGRRWRPRIGAGLRLGWAIMRRDPVAWLIALGLWLLFHGAPVVTGWALGQVLDSITDGAPASTTWAAIALLAGLEVARWSMFLAAVVQWHGGWVAWHTRPRMALLDSLVSDPGPATGRLPGSPGEAVSRFRDDTEDVALVLDVWLDVIAVALSSLVAVAILATIDPRVAATVAAPALVVMVITHSMGPALRRWRRAAREATAEVTGFVGDSFGAIGAVKALGAERSVLARFDALGHSRAREAVRDEVGTQLLDSLSRSTADIGLALALVVAAPVVAGGDMSVGDLGVIAAYSTVLAGLPRFMGRLGAYHRQADVSAERLARLLPADRRDLESVAGDAELHLRAPRHLPADSAIGPVPGSDDPDLLPRGGLDGVSRHPAHAGGPPSGLEVVGLTVVHPGGRALSDVDLRVPPGSVVAVTGPVGSGKSSLLRAVLGLIPSEGAVRWDGDDVRDNPRLMVPPRVAYVPQVPRLFSEPLTDAVLLGLPPERLDVALHLACMEQDVAAMPRGVATVVGSRGVRLSGGQVQRVAAARALARRPALLVVDDLSSALDAATESALWDRILAAVDLDGTSVLVVTHRPAVLARADEVVHLVGGRRDRPAPLG